MTGGSDESALARAPAGPGPAGPGPAGPAPAGAGQAGPVPAGPAFAGADPGWRRLSRRSMVVRPLTDLVRLLPLLAGLVLLHARTGGGLAWGIAAAVLAVVSGLVHWATTRYLITGERVYLRRGLLNQKTLSVARDRIRTVDVTAHLLHRVLGVCRVSIGTGRNDYRPGESFHLDGVTSSEAESLRRELLSSVRELAATGAMPGSARAPAAPASAPAPAAAAAAGPGPAYPASAAAASVPTASVRPVSAPAAPGEREADAFDAGAEIVRWRISWLLFAPLTMTGLVVLGVLFGVVVQVNNATDINLAATGPVQRLVADFAALDVLHRILVGGAVAFGAYVLIAMIGYIAVFWDFRLAERGADTLRVTRGLLSLRATTISRARLRGVEISEPLLLRAARGARCIAIATGLQVGRGAEREGSVLLPPAPRAVATQVAGAVLGLPEEICAGQLLRHGPAARRRRYMRALASAAAVVAAIWFLTSVQHGPAWVRIASLALLPAGALIAADRYRSLGHRLVGGWLVTRTGSLARRRAIISTDAIIGWRIHQTWLQRRQGLVTLTATTAAGQQHYSVRDVPTAEGLSLAAEATAELLAPFLRAPSRQD
jgi:putative membrane protein